MTPQEKAKSLIEKFKRHDYDWIAQSNLYVVKKSSLITVDEILSLIKDELSIDYWLQVKTELISL